MTTLPNSREARASIAAMPKRLRPILLALILAVSAAVYGCGNSGPDPSIAKENSQVLLAKIAEIKANVDVGSCLVAADKTDDLLADIADLPSSVNNDVKQALDSGANNLKLLLTDPSKCAGRTATTTTQPTTSDPVDHAGDHYAAHASRQRRPATQTQTHSHPDADHAQHHDDPRRLRRDRAGRTMSPRSPSGELIADRYRIEDRLGSGGMSIGVPRDRHDPRAHGGREDPRRAPLGRRALRGAVPA